MTPSVYKFNVDSSLSAAIDFMTAREVCHISDSNKKVRELHDRLIVEGYNPFELLLYFTNEWVGIGGFDQLRIINRWTSDAVWIGFKEYKHKLGQTAQRLYTIECNEISTRLDNDLSSKLEILTSEVCSYKLAGPVVKLDLAMAWIADKPDAEIDAWIQKHWHLALIFIMAMPELLPYVNNLRNHLLQEGSIS